MAAFIIAENDVERKRHSSLWRHELDYHMVLIDKWSLLHVYSKILSNIYDEIGQMPVHTTHYMYVCILHVYKYTATA